MKTEIVHNGNQVIAKFIGRLDTPSAVQTAEDVKPLMEVEFSNNRPSYGLTEHRPLR